METVDHVLRMTIACDGSDGKEYRSSWRSRERDSASARAWLAIRSAVSPLQRHFVDQQTVVESRLECEDNSLSLLRHIPDLCLIGEARKTINTAIRTTKNSIEPEETIVSSIKVVTLASRNLPLLAYYPAILTGCQCIAWLQYCPAMDFTFHDTVLGNQFGYAFTHLEL